MADYSLLVNVEAIDKASHVFKTIQGNVNSFKQNLEGTAAAGVGSMEQLGTSMQTLGSNMTNTGRLMTTTVTTPIVGLGVASTKAAIDFEEAFTGVRKTVDTTEDNFQKLSDGIKQMSTETASTKTEIAGVMEVAGQLGVEVGKDGETLLAFTKTMVQLGDTTNLSAEEAATALAHFTNITGVSQDQVSNLGSAIVDLGNNFATDEASILNMSTRLASAGTIAGLTSTDILALSTAMSSVGIQAEAGGTAMAQTLAAMSSAVADFEAGSTEDLEAIANVAGMTADEFATQWQNKPIVALQAFISGLGTLDEKGENATLVLDELGMSGVRQSNMLQSLALASDVLGDAIDTSSSAFSENTALAAEAEKRYGTTASQISQLKEEFSNCAVTVGEMLIPFMKQGMEVLSGVAQAFNNLPEGMQQTIVSGALLLAAAGPLLMIGGKLISGIGTLITLGAKVGGVVGGIGTASAAAAPAVGTAGTAMGTLSANALGFIALGAGILLAAAGLALLAQAAIALGQAGAPAAVAMGAMVAVIALLAVGAAALAPALTAGAVGLVAFGAAVALVGVGILAASAGMTLLASQLPTIAQYGNTAAIAVAALGAAMLVYSAGVMTAAGSSTALAGAIVILAAGMATGTLSATAMGLAFAGAALSTVALDVALAAMLVTVSGIAGAATTASQAMSDIQSSIDVVKTGVDGLGTLFSTTVTTIIGVFTSNTGTAQAAALAFGTAITLGAKTGLTPIQADTTLTMAAVLLVITTSMTQANSTMTGKMNMMKSTVQTGMNNIKQTWQTGLQGLNNTTSQQMQQLQNTVQQALNSIQQKFASTQLRFNQHIELPHFSMSGSFNAQTGETPSVSVSWYRKAYDQAYMFQTPTVFGASGFGDGNGTEIVVGDDHLLELMREALAGGSDSGDIIIPVYIGNERLDELVVTAQQRYNYRSGGRS